MTKSERTVGLLCLGMMVLVVDSANLGAEFLIAYCYY